MAMASTREERELVRDFLQAYFDAWKGTDLDRILAYYSDDVMIQLPTGTLNGKPAVREHFVQPFVGGFPGNVHAMQRLALAPNLVAVEWEFQAVHAGQFLGIPATGRRVNVPGCSFYQYDLDQQLITGGHLYFDVGTLMRQLGV
jgi:steroid delta-isomerase-like uncharacterized protein